MAMSPVFSTYSWTFLLLLSFSCVIYSHKCKWLHRKNENVSKQILQTFNQMIPETASPETCLNNPLAILNIGHLYQISQVESAALAAQNLYNHIIQFYRKHQKELRWKLHIWEKLQCLLCYQINQLSDCISYTAENNVFAEAILQFFNRLEKIIHDQDNKVCAQRIIHSEIGRNLRMADQLSSRMRIRQLMKTPL